MKSTLIDLSFLFSFLFMLTGTACRADAPLPLPDLAVINNPALSLQGALSIAQADNVSLEKAKADAAAADATASMAQSQEKPSLSTTTYASLGDSSNILSTSPGVSPQNLFNIPAGGFADQDLMLMVPLLTGGKLSSNTAMAQTLSRASALDVQDSDLIVTNAITTDYANAALAQAIIDAAKSQVTAENEQVRITQEKVATGALAPVDLLREQAAYDQASETLLAAQNEDALDLVELKTALGVSQRSSIILSDTLDIMGAGSPAVPATLDDSLRLAEENQPDLAAAEQRMQSGRLAVKAAESAFSPQVYGVAMGDAMTGQDMNRLGYTVGVTASIPLSEGGERHAGVRQAKANLQVLEAEAEQLRESIDQEVATAWLSLQTNDARITAATAGLAAAQQDYALADLRYNAGRSTTVDRLDALSAYTQAQESLAQAKADQIISRSNLLTTLGED